MLQSLSSFKKDFLHFGKWVFLGCGLSKPGGCLCLVTSQGGGPAGRTLAWHPPRSGSRGEGQHPVAKEEKEAS